VSPRRVLVTGGAGFIGSHVAEAYLARGDRVWIVDDLSTGRLENVPEGAEFIRMDIRDAKLDDVFRDAGGFDLVSHHAAQMDVRKSVADPRMDASINLDGLLNVLECGRRHGVGRFVFISSGGVIYGEATEFPTPEDAVKRPLSPYGVAKLASEYYLNCYRSLHGLDYVALRYGNVYGPRQDPHGEAGVVALFSRRIGAGEPLIVYGTGEQTRDYVYVGDVVDAHLLVSDAGSLAADGIDERAYNVGTGVETTVNELAHRLMEVSGRDARVEHAAPRAGELQRSCLDVARLRALGWEPRTTLREGLARTFAYIQGEGAGR